MEAVGDHILVKMTPELISLRKGKRKWAQIRNQRGKRKRISLSPAAAVPLAYNSQLPSHLVPHRFAG
jgi:hypothetical protein